ncbi:ATP-dependent helicase [Candidatus Phytoplasma australiense]|uniref:DNA 3'-5' helicase n=1 Tax=Strawberry lethal yellows phytoplasma (CPA) str. NZSb11 TaxID=980422 RepID=R4S123_PHYAS|nr:UvrD-helicase domain-containing protein [Candidatus Phytoplasma australiense]AGL90438.1 ATP-dependent DNA helicase pcrA [Strawberry lethal yellows phytoplasma (CPA) str. NZSb11]
MSSKIDSWLKKLNKNQVEAATSKSLATYLLAGAGTGKTTTLTTKIAYLIEKQNFLSKNILTLTFTNKAADQMKNKILEMIGEKSKGVNILTFHALGNRILRQFINILPFNYNRNFIILNDKECNQILKIVAKEVNFDIQKVENIDNLRKEVFRLKKKTNEFLQHQQTSTQNNNPLIVKIKNQYQKYLQKNNLVDFNDLILYTYQLLKEYPEIKQFWQKKFQYILVDEFQDTDFYQYQILTFLTEKNPCIFVVGDPDQNIYSFRGACFGNSQLFLNKFNPQIYVLKQNYRSSENILEKANLLISYNKDHPFKKKLNSVKGKGTKVNAHFFVDSRIEAQYIVQKIKHLVQIYHYNYRDFAILYRVNSLGHFLEKYLISAGIPYMFLGNLSFYQKKVVKDFLAYLHLAVNPLQDFYLRRVINVPKRQIGKITITCLEKIVQEKERSFFEILKDYKDIPVSDKTQKQLYQFYCLIEELNNKIINNEFEKLSDIITYVDQKTQYSYQISLETQKNPQKSNEEQSSLVAIEELKSILNQIDESFQGSNLQKINNFLEEVSLNNETKINNSSGNKANNRVKLATIHKVKGLEFKVVFLAGLEKEFFDDLDDIQESRRLTYVAVTRAQEKLFLTGVSQRMLFGKNFSHEPSVFFKEMGFGSRKNYFLSQTQKPFQKGDQVRHNLFGLGIVLELERNNIIVEFVNPKKTKMFENSFKYLQKI